MYYNINYTKTTFCIINPSSSSIYAPSITQSMNAHPRCKYAHYAYCSRLDQAYVSVVLGPFGRVVGGPHGQVIPVAASVPLEDQGAVLLRLRSDATATRYARPLPLRWRYDYYVIRTLLPFTPHYNSACIVCPSCQNTQTTPVKRKLHNADGKGVRLLTYQACLFVL